MGLSSFRGSGLRVEGLGLRLWGWCLRVRAPGVGCFTCIYVSVYAYTCMYIYIYTYYMRVYIYTYMYIHMYIHIQGIVDVPKPSATTTLALSTS